MKPIEDARTRCAKQSSANMRMHSGFTLALAAGLLLSLVGCSQTFQRQTCVPLAKEVNYCLSPLMTDRQAGSAASANNADSNVYIAEGSELSPRSQTQKVTLIVDGNRHELLTQFELDAHQLTLVGLAPLGQALFTLVYDGNTLTSQQSILLGDGFKAEYLLALMQLIYWPEYMLNNHLQGARLSSIACDAINPSATANLTTCRRLDSTANNQQILTIEYSEQDPWLSEVRMHIKQAKLELNITPLL